ITSNISIKHSIMNNNKLITIVALICFAIAVTAAARPTTTETEYRSLFAGWMLKYQRNYEHHEFAHRYATFKANHQYIVNWNARNSQTKLGLNKMADLTNSEYQALYLTLRARTVQTEVESFVRETPIVGSDVTIVDWRAHGFVTPVDDFGMCAASYAYAAVGSMETTEAIVNGKLIPLSDQQIIDCSAKFGNQGCNSGLPLYTFEYVVENNGIDTAAAYPWTGKSGKCKFSPTEIGAKFSSYVNVTTGSEASLEAAVNLTSVAVLVDASHSSFQLYDGGVYYEPGCSSTELDLAMLVVGYGIQTPSTGYWIARNDWGVDWGVNGYIMMAKDKHNNCGIASAGNYPIV
ncbi:hypothetical protein SAMD00019534_024340, partial [Acytostelium subglobosum LB1]|uniref:hypothetical protein n=1 Tax=Acytostelium subglobosum LB1 TaxID=1410327 RepID=UPI000644A1FB